jgi:hypothetical protein
VFHPFPLSFLFSPSNPATMAAAMPIEAIPAPVVEQQLEQQIQDAMQPLVANTDMYTATKRLLVLAGINVAEDATPSDVGGTCAARACKLAGPFPPFTPQDVLSAARAAPNT